MKKILDFILTNKYDIKLTAANSDALTAIGTANSLVLSFPSEFTIAQQDSASTCSAAGVDGGSVSCQVIAANKLAINKGTLTANTLSFAWTSISINNPYKSKLVGQIGVQFVRTRKILLFELIQSYFKHLKIQFFHFGLFWEKLTRLLSNFF